MPLNLKLLYLEIILFSGYLNGFVTGYVFFWAGNLVAKLEKKNK